MPNWSDVDTPAVLIDLEKVSANLLRVQGMQTPTVLRCDPTSKPTSSIASQICRSNSGPVESLVKKWEKLRAWQQGGSRTS